MFRVECLEYSPAVRASLARRERMVLLGLQVVGTVRSCRFMCVSVTGIRGHSDRGGEKHEHICRKLDQSFRFRCVSSIPPKNTINKKITKIITITNKFALRQGWGWGLRVEKFLPEDPWSNGRIQFHKSGSQY